MISAATLVAYLIGVSVNFGKNSLLKSLLKHLDFLQIHDFISFIDS